MTRPNGKLYKARKGWAVWILDGEWNQLALVLRCKPLDEARALADPVIKASLGSSCSPGSAQFGWWRQTIRNNEPYWDHDSVRGAPGWLFEVVE